MNEVTYHRFGYYGQTNKQGDYWHEVFKNMIEDIYYDAKRKQILIPVEEESLLKLLQRDKELFEMVTEPRFVHWDIWAGNVFIDNCDVTGIIDFERCLWGDELMEVGFRTYDRREAFFEGYGKSALTKEEERRAKWYDIYLFLISSLECDYRMYDNRWAYEWGTDMLEKWVTKLLEE